MHLLNVIVLCMLLSLVTCELGCFYNKVIQCQREYYIHLGFEESSFCKSNPYMTKCMADAANECSTGFEEEAEKAHRLVKDLCTGGSKSHEVLKKDDNCDIETFITYEEICSEGLSKEADYLEDYFEVLKVTCRWNDRISKCMHDSIGKKCSTSTQDVFREIEDANDNLQRKICERM